MNSFFFLLLDERDDFDKQIEQIQSIYQQLQSDFNRLKQNDNHHDEKHFEEFKQLLKHVDETNNNLKELARIQRLLTSKGHRIDFRVGSELNGNLKTLEGFIQNEIERTEKVLQTENDFHQLEKEFEKYLQLSSEQLKSAQLQQDKGTAYQVRKIKF